MNTFTASSLVAASMLLAACGSAGSVDTPMTSSPLDDHPLNRMTPPLEPTGPVTPDTLILSSEIEVDNSGSGVDCLRLTCADVLGINNSVSDYGLSDETAFNRNGLVNRSTRRAISGLFSEDTKYYAYDYWMGDSMFSVYHNPTHFAHPSSHSLVLGNNTGSRPSGTAIYSGKTVAVTTKRPGYGDVHYGTFGDVHHGTFTGVYNFRNNEIGIGIFFPHIGVNTSFDKVPVSSNGSFSVGDKGTEIFSGDDTRELDGAFFGRNHNEVAGTYFLPNYDLVGSFGGIKN